MTGALVRYETAAGVATLTLARPDKLNAFTSAMLAELRGLLSRAATDRSLRVLVLTGEGRAFSAGQDLSLIDPEIVSEVLARDYTPLVEALLGHPLVTIAALNGPAVGAAANVALACDVVVAAERASLAQAFVKIGLIPDAGGTWLLPRIVGVRNAMALALTGDSIGAREAQAMGMVYRVFPDEGFAAEVAALAQGIAARSPLALRLIKRSLGESLGNGLAAQLALEAELQGEAARSEAFRDAVAGFLARRRG